MALQRNQQELFGEHDPLDFLPDEQQPPHQEQKAAEADAHEVTFTLLKSVQQLLARYSVGKAPNINNPDFVRTLITEIDEYIKSCAIHNKASATGCVTKIQQMQDAITPEKWGSCQLTLPQILALIWQACKDDQAAVQGQPVPIKNDEMAARKDSLIKHLIAAETDSHGAPVCFVGHVSRIVDSLNLIHPDVNIRVLGRDEAFTILLEQVNSKFILPQLETKPIREQRIILKHWEDENPNNPSTPFKKGILRQISRDRDLNNLVKLIPNKTMRDFIDDLVASWHCPLHEALSNLLLEILALPDNLPDMRNDIAKLKNLARIEVHGDGELTLEEEYEFLQSEYAEYKEKLKKLYDESYKKLENLIKEIQAIPDSENPVLRELRADLKKQAKAYGPNHRQGRTENKYLLLRQQHKAITKAYGFYIQQTVLYEEQCAKIKHLERGIKNWQKLNGKNEYAQKALTRLERWCTDLYAHCPLALQQYYLPAAVRHYEIVQKLCNAGFYECLTALAKQAIELQREQYTHSAQAAETLIKNLNDEVPFYLDSIHCRGLDHNKRYEKFKTACLKYIDDAKPILELHHGFKCLLANLALAICGAVVIYLVAGCIHQYTTGSFLFFNKDKTRSAKADEIRDIFIKEVASPYKR